MSTQQNLWIRNKNCLTFHTLYQIKIIYTSRKVLLIHRVRLKSNSKRATVTTRSSSFHASSQSDIHFKRVCTVHWQQTTQPCKEVPKLQAALLTKLVKATIPYKEYDLECFTRAVRVLREIAQTFLWVYPSWQIKSSLTHQPSSNIFNFLYKMTNVQVFTGRPTL